MPNIQIAISLCLFLATPAVGLPLANMPVQVGGYVLDDQGQAIEAATVTFIDQTSQDEYQGTTDSVGWYGNVEAAGVPKVPTGRVLGNAYPNPFGPATTIEIHSDGLDKGLSSDQQELQIYDLRGRLVGSVPALPGTHQVQARGDASLPKGTYFYKLGGEVQKMAGSPKWVTVKVSSGSAEKAVLEYRMIVEADGFEIEDVLVYLDDSQINIISTNLFPAISSYSKPVAFQVRSIAGDQRQAIGEVVLRNASGVEFLAMADVDSVYLATVEVASESELLTIFPRGITGFESMTYVILDPDSVAVRGLIADATPFNYPQFPDTARVAFDHYAFDKELFLEIVPDFRMAQGAFKQSVQVIFKRYYDRRVEILTNTAESDYTIPAPQYAIDWLVQAENNLVDMLENTADGIPLIRSTVFVLHTYSGIYTDPWGNIAIAYRSINNDLTPGNTIDDISGDGFMDYHAAHIRDSDGLGVAIEEVGNEFAHDYHGTITDLWEAGTFQFNSLGRDVAATWAKFSNGRNFDPSLKDEGGQ